MAATKPLMMSPVSTLVLAVVLAIGATASEETHRTRLKRDASSETGFTLAFVFDTTGSMTDELAQVKQAMRDIFQYMKENRDHEIANYALVPFDDPSVGPITITTDTDTYRRSLDAIRITVGGEDRDCPEMAMGGIILALERTLPHSYLFVFTDASAKDHYRRSEVENLVQRKKSKVVFVLTGRCDSESDPAYQAYHGVARVSNGHVFNLLKNEVHKVLTFVKLDTKKKGIVDVEEIPAGPAKNIKIPVDSSTDEFTVTGTGKKPTIVIKDPEGKETPGETILDLDSVLSKRVTHPKPGNWTADVSVKGPGRVVVAAESKFEFKYGFSVKPTDKMEETAPRPLIGTDNALLIEVTDETQLSHLTEVIIRDGKDNILKRFPLRPVPGNPKVYKADSFTPPTSVFYLQIYGKDNTDNVIKRISDSGITPQPPAPPIITMEATLTAFKGLPYTIYCHVESLVGFTTFWMKGGRKVDSDRSYTQSTKVPLIIPVATESSVGTYTCTAKNIAGTTTKDIQLTIKAPPPIVKTPQNISLHLNKPGEILCDVRSELTYSVQWTKLSDAGTPQTISDSRYTTKGTGNLIISKVKESDGGWYICSATSTSGKNESRVFVEIQDPVEVSVSSSKSIYQSGNDISLTCKAIGSPPITQTWRKDGRNVEVSRRVQITKMETNILNLKINNAEKSDEGKYECEGSNDVNAEKMHTFLTYVEAPKVKFDENYTQLKEHTALYLECPATGIPSPTITWEKNGKSLSRGLEKILTNSTLYIASLSSQNSATFTCTAENEYGKAQDTIKLDVGSKPRFSGDSSFVEVDILTSGSIPCHLSGYPPPLIKWKRKDGETIDEERFILGSGCELEIADAQVQDKGAYIVTAENSFGKSEKEFFLNISGIVKPLISLDGGNEVLSVSGKPKEIPCTILYGHPKPIISWYKDGEKLSDKDAAALGITTHANDSIVFSFIKPENEGSYECEAENVGGKARKLVELKVLEPPLFAGPEHEILKVRPGNTLPLPCAVYGKPKPRVIWKKDSEIISFGTSNIGRNPRDDSILLRSVNNENNGTFTCTAINSAGQNTKTIDVLVQDVPKIISISETYYPVEGEEVTMYCTAKAFPEAKITWLKDGAPLDVTVSHSSNNSSFSFVADVTSSGKYECVATNEAGEDRQETHVIVTVSPIFENELEIVQASIGDNLTLSCYTEASPPPDYFWRKYPEEVSAAKDSALTFYNVGPDDDGMYNCEVVNFAGYAQKIFIVKINVPPKIFDLPKVQFLKEGFDFDLPCLADGEPEPKTRWLKNGKPIISEDGDDALLKIRNANADDAGLYSCIAENYEGSDQKDMEIKVEVPPTFRDVESSYVEVNESQPALLACPAMQGNPLPTVEWLKHGRSVNSTKLSRIQFKDGGKTLRIRNTRQKDSGVYSCVATNSAGYAKANITLQVLTLPSFIKNGAVSHDISKLEGTTVDLDCSSTGNPLPKVSWLRNKHPIVPFTSPRTKISADGQILTIKNSQIADTGEYTCTVENKVGKIQKTFNVDIYVNVRPEAEVDFSMLRWSSWSHWSACSASCGRSEQVRIRRCLHREGGCTGPAEEWKKCTVSDCEVDGGWSKWGKWSICTEPCGGGKRYRYRVCDNPAPENGGEFCYGGNRQHEDCNIDPCPIDGGWTEWTEWLPCAGACTSSISKRSRKCANPTPAFGGANCTGERQEIRSCVQKGCPVDGDWSSWSSWGPCSATCGQSQRQRERFCNNPEPAFGGKTCAGDKRQTEKCETEVCDGIPLSANIQLDGSLNGQRISQAINDVQINDLATERVLRSTHKNILRKQPGWFPYLLLAAQPIMWTTAYQKDGATNGYTLTKGHFTQRTTVTFDTGETSQLTFQAEGKDSDGALKLKIDWQGQVPLFHLRTEVLIEPYEETYVQVAPGKLYGRSRNTMEGGGMAKPYSWNYTIAYDKELGTQKSLVQTLSVRDLKDSYQETPTKLLHYASASISAKDGGSCPDGFTLDSYGYCEDVNECLDTHKSKCHYTQICVNTQGSYDCECPEGLQSPAIGAECKDIDECDLSPPICSHHCQNMEGSFKCLCPPGLGLIGSNTTCSSIELKEMTPGRKTGSWSICLPGQVIVDGICQADDKCKGGAHMCEDHEICINMHGLYKCLPVRCPEKYVFERHTKSCTLHCTLPTNVCETGASVSQTEKPIVITQEGPVLPYKDLLTLPSSETTERVSYRILENEEDKPFRIKMKGGNAVLYSQKHLPAGREYNVVIGGYIYDTANDKLLKSMKYIVTLFTSD